MTSFWKFVLLNFQGTIHRPKIYGVFETVADILYFNKTNVSMRHDCYVFLFFRYKIFFFRYIHLWERLQDLQGVMDDLTSFLQQISPNEWHRLVDSESALREAFENSTSALCEAVNKKHCIIDRFSILVSAVIPKILTTGGKALKMYQKGKMRIENDIRE